MATWVTTAINWPAIQQPAFPLPSTRHDGSVRNTADDGTPYARNRFTRNLRSWDLKWLIMNDADWTALDTFWNVTTAGGTLPFNWTHPYTGEALVIMFADPIKESLDAPNQHSVQLTLQEV